MNYKVWLEKTTKHSRRIDEREERNVNAATGKWAATDRKTHKKKKFFCARFEQRTRFCIFAFSQLHNFLGPMEYRNQIEVRNCHRARDLDKFSRQRAPKPQFYFSECSRLADTRSSYVIRIRLLLACETHSTRVRSLHWKLWRSLAVNTVDHMNQNYISRKMRRVRCLGPVSLSHTDLVASYNFSFSNARK